MYVHTCLSADTQDCWSLLAIWETMKLMAADVVAIRLGEKVREGGGFASSLQTWRGGQSSELRGEIEECNVVHITIVRTYIQHKVMKFSTNLRTYVPYTHARTHTRTHARTHTHTHTHTHYTP